jgi:hypothetical protein
LPLPIFDGRGLGAGTAGRLDVSCEKADTFGGKNVTARKAIDREMIDAARIWRFMLPGMPWKR